MKTGFAAEISVIYTDIEYQVRLSYFFIRQVE